MNRKKVLAISTSCVITVGVILAMTPFVSSLKPSARADAQLKRFEMSRLEVEDLSILSGPSLGEVFDGYEIKLLGYRSSDGSLKVWQVPAKNGDVGMPDLHWCRPIHSCSRLSVIDIGKGATISCVDEDIPDWWAKEWRWDLNGVNLGGMVDDLVEATGVVENGYFVYAKSS